MNLQTHSRMANAAAENTDFLDYGFGVINDHEFI